MAGSTYISYVITSCTVLLLSVTLSVRGETTVSVSAPVNPVRETGILSLRCQVSNLQSNHEVRISRDVGNQTQTLSWNTVIALEDDARIFLAVRQLDDGSVVYFLTIIKASRTDEGIYSCKVVDPVKLIAISEGSTPIKFQYFPAEPPSCNPDRLPPVMAGTMVTLNCSSIGTRSIIDVNWSRTGDGKIARSKITTTDTRIYASVTLKPSLSDDGAMFFCKVTSHAFPDKMSTCHVGPLKVLPDPRAPISTESDVRSPPNYPIVPIDHDTFDRHDDILNTNDDTLAFKCSAICDRNAASTLYWVIATFLAGIIALTFCIVAVAIALRLHRAKRDMTTLQRIGGLQPRQEIYLELEGDKFDENRIYMALDQCRKTGGNVTYGGKTVGGNANYGGSVCHPMLDSERNYTSTPIAPMSLPKRPMM